jgi:hypothetical protein
LLMVIQFVIGDNYCYADDYRYALLIHALWPLNIATSI